MFKGLSTLRAGEKQEKPQSEQSKALQAYLAAQYGAGPGGDAEKKKKKKKKREAGGPGIKILDQDVSGFVAPSEKRPAAPGARPLPTFDADEEDDEDEPVVANAEEAERLKRVAEREKQFYQKLDDGSGWAVVGEGAAGDASPPRRQRHDSPDASPPRRQRHDSPDASPPRRRQASADASPPRRQAAAADASPPRRQHGMPDAGASPPRKRRASEPSGDDEAAAEAEAKRRRMMSDGTVAGMVSGREVMEEMARKREREQERFAELGADVTGRGAQTVFRDREGRRVSKEAFLEEQAAAKRKAQYDSEAQLEWGGGLKQRVDAAERAAAQAAEASKPFARSRDDAELDAMHRRRSRWGDPMAGLVKAPPAPEALPSLVERHAERLKKSGFVIPQEVPKHSWLRRGVGAPVNRYGIRPGRHWDGVDRGNGFEAGMFKRQNELKQRAQEAFYMAQEDM